MTIVSASPDTNEPWCSASSFLKYEAATVLAVCTGRAGAGGSGDMLRRGDFRLADDGDMRLIELERRGGATPLAECRELSDAFRSSVGVAEREGGPFGEGWPFKGLRRAQLGRGELGFSTVELNRRGEALVGDAVERESCFRDWARSLS